MRDIKLYKGTALRTKTDAEAFELEPYLPSDNLVVAVQLAQKLQRPLLVKGEPGCGKSRLAEAIAAELHGTDYRKYYFEWNIKSTSKAIDGLYNIDYLQRLRDANFKDKKEDLEIKLEQDENMQYEEQGHYVSLQELGRAFRATQTPGLNFPPVVLIDEIDKADIDFPNDLLLELDRMEFKIPEAKNENKKTVVIKALQNLKPIVIVTSNDEKPLPPAFLRRCLFYYIEFSEIKLADIVAARFPELSGNTNFSMATVVKRFIEMRQMIADRGITPKNISTSELLDWISLLEFDVNAGETIDLQGTLPRNYPALVKDRETKQLFAQSAIQKPTK
jgi:MoxR-like ATPase